MIFTYYAIFREANRQEKQLAARQGNAMLMHRHSSAGGTNGTYGKQQINKWQIFKLVFAQTRLAQSSINVYY